MDASNKLPAIKLEKVQAYAETRTTESFVARPQSLEQCRAVLEFAGEKGLTICNRGAGYTYGDMILNDKHLVLDLSRLNRILAFDRDAGRIIVQPGVRFADIFKLILRDNWTLNSCPGGMEATIGGAVSNNVHGKDSWKNGNFGEQILSLKLLKADGDIISIGPSENPALFQAVVGGMGLLGIILEVKLRLRKIPCAFVEVSSSPTGNYQETLDLLEEAKENSDFSVAWVDAFAAGKSIGRGFVTSARWVDRGLKVSPGRLTRSLQTPTRIFGLLPAKPVWFLLRPFFLPGSIRMANIANYTLSQLRNRLKPSAKHTLLFSDYLFMHNKIPDLKHVYRPYGFLEFQPIIPRSAGAGAVQGLFELCRRHNCQSLLCGIKTHRADDFLISYSGEGYSIGVDIQIRGRNPDEINNFARAIFEYIVECGGRTFLAKDELLPRDLFQRMYPGYQEFLKIKRMLDPEEMFVSDMYRRLLQ